jgi:hypothetical protein
MGHSFHGFKTQYDGWHPLFNQGRTGGVSMSFMLFIFFKKLHRPLSPFLHRSFCCQRRISSDHFPMILSSTCHQKVPEDDHAGKATLSAKWGECCGAGYEKAIGILGADRGRQGEFTTSVSLSTVFFQWTALCTRRPIPISRV